MFNFEKFPVYIQSENVFEKLQKVFLDKRITKELRDQLYRSSSSIILNIAEGSGKFTKKEKRNFYSIARGSTQESVAIIKVLRIQNIISEHDYAEVYTCLESISKMLSGLIKKMSE